MFCFNVRVTINYTHKRALTHFDIESCGSLVSQGRAALINVHLKKETFMLDMDLKIFYVIFTWSLKKFL